MSMTRLLADGTLEKVESVLTLRYYPRDGSPLTRMSWPDFIEFEGIEKCFEQVLEIAIRTTVESMRPRKIGMGISGGVDSTTVLAVTRKLYPDIPVDTFYISFGDDETEKLDAEKVSEMYGTRHRHIRVENPLKDLPRQIGIVKEPRWNLYSEYIFKAASEAGCDLILTGDGGDELFGGYVFRYGKVLDLVEKGQDVVGAYLKGHERDWVPDQQDIFTSGFSWEWVKSLIQENFDNDLPILGKVFLADYNGKLLYDFAPTNTRFSLYYNMPYRAPFLSDQVLSIAPHIPYRFKYDAYNNLGKIILRQILLENFGYKVAVKDKIGWTVDVVGLWDTHARSLCLKAFEDARFLKSGMVRREWLYGALAKADEHDIRYINKMLGLYALELWLRGML